MSDRPHVVVDPAQNFGNPAVARTRIPTAAIVGVYVAGDTVEALLDDHALTREDLLVACWYEARYGARTEEWAAWLEQWQGALWRREFEAVPLPPQEREDDEHAQQ